MDPLGVDLLEAMMIEICMYGVRNSSDFVCVHAESPSRSLAIHIKLGKVS